MKNTRLIIFSCILIFLLFITSSFAQKKQEINQIFEAKDELKIKLVLGECTLKMSADKNIHVHLAYSYDDDYFEPILRETGDKLIIQEKFYGKNGGGFSRWTISVPDGVEIDYESATGDLIIEGVKCEIDGNTGTGNIEIRESNGGFELNTGTGSIIVDKCEGEFELNSGTGRVKIEASKGDFDANSGTGRVIADDITIDQEGDFNSGTGEVEISRPHGTDFDLSVSSGTDDAVLIMGGLPIEGYFEFSAHARRGNIRSPVDFDDEREYEDGDSNYVRKSFTKGKKTPRFFISTGTGTAELKK